MSGSYAKNPLDIIGEALAKACLPSDVCAVVGKKFAFTSGADFIAGTITSIEGILGKKPVRLRVTSPRFCGVDISYLEPFNGEWFAVGQDRRIPGTFVLSR